MRLALCAVPLRKLRRGVTLALPNRHSAENLFVYLPPR